MTKYAGYRIKELYVLLPSLLKAGFTLFWSIASNVILTRSNMDDKTDEHVHIFKIWSQQKHR